jgi:hypothetical protein
MSTMTDRETVAAAVRIVRELTEDVGASTRKYPRGHGTVPCENSRPQAATQELIKSRISEIKPWQSPSVTKPLVGGDRLDLSCALSHKAITADMHRRHQRTSRGLRRVAHMEPLVDIQLSLARVMGPPDCQGDGTTVARY